MSNFESTCPLPLVPTILKRFQEIFYISSPLPRPISSAMSPCCRWTSKVELPIRHNTASAKKLKESRLHLARKMKLSCIGIVI